LTTRCGLGLDASWMHLLERKPCGCYDSLGIGDVNVNWRLWGSGRVQIYTGLGLRLFHDDHAADSGLETGFNFTVFGDWQPCKPLVLSAEVDVGTIRSASLFHGRMTAGVVHRGVEFFLGYDYLQIDEIPFDGPLAGLRLWF
jgi:hypothetical protein